MPLMPERKYQAHVIREIRRRMPNSVVLKNDANYMQGILDLTVLLGRHWGMLEVKRSAHEPLQPNQDYYLSMFGSMSYVGIIYPENEARILDELQSALEACGNSRLSGSK